MEAKAKRKAGAKTTNPPIIQSIEIRQTQRTTQTVGKWRTALQAAESITNPNRTLLYDLYLDLILDAQLKNTTEARKRKITNSKITFTKEGEINDQVQELIESPVFFNLLADLIDARFWGYSLIEFYYKDGLLAYNLIPRKHVKPEFGIVVRNSNDTTGINYSEAPINNYTLSAGTPNDLGLYLSAAQYVLYKRGCFGDWAQFAEIFGMPFRFGKYDGFDETTRLQLNAALEAMGSAAHAVFPKGAEIEVVQNNNNGNGEVYEKLKNAADEQIALIMLGQTMTTKDGASLSQAMVHAEVAEQVFIDDRRFILNTLNHDFKRILETFGLPNDGDFDFVDESRLSLKDRVYIDTQLAQHIILDADYWFKTYGIDKPDNYDQLVKDAEAKKQAEIVTKNLDKKQQPTKLGTIDPKTTRKMAAFYNPPATKQNFLNGLNPFAADLGAIPKKDFKALDTEAKRLATLIYNGELPNNYFVSETMVGLIENHLKQAIETGYGANFAAAEGIDAATVTAMKKNIYKFSAAKNYNMLADMNAALIDSNGQRVSLNNFNKAVEKLNIEYNRNWQATEYNNAQASAQMAGKYNQFQADADTGMMLTFTTANDEHVREDHRRIDGMTAPATDPIWRKYWPPLDWGCRCDVIQDEREDAGRFVPREDLRPVIGKGFEKNAATGEVFSKKHPYFKGVPKEVAKKIFK